MIQDKMVRARRQYHNNNNNNHHYQHQQPQQQQQQQHNHHHNQYQPNSQANSQRNALNHNHHFHHRHSNNSSKRNNQNNNNNSNHHANSTTHFVSAPSNTTQFIMNDHELIEPDFDLMHNAIMEHYNRNKKRKHSGAENEIENQQKQENVDNNEKSGLDKSRVGSGKDSRADDESGDDDNLQKRAKQFKAATEADSKDIENNDSAAAVTTTPTTKQLTEQQSENLSLATATTTIVSRSPRKGAQNDLVEESKSQQQNQKSKQTTTTSNSFNTTMMTTQLQESTNQSNPTTPSYRPNTTGSPGDEDGLSPFINHEHLQSSEFQEVYANIHTERLSSMSKNQLVDQYLLLEERVEELENQLRESQTATAAAAAASHG